MNDAMRSRGPDGGGVFVDAQSGVVLGNRRLAVIDLSDSARQPMSSAHGDCWITYNGAIYNFVKLRAELEALGHHFASRSDTEVLLASYQEWGRECVHRLRGMFAFAIYDRRPSRPDKWCLFLARDRLGIKPLYYAQPGTPFVFASTIAALLASGVVSRRVDRQAVWDFLSLGSVAQPRTILADVSMLLPGHAIRLDERGTAEVYQYWDIARTAHSWATRSDGPTLEQAAVELRALLNESARLHMAADVPVGALLSGGVDSTAVVGLMNQYASKPVKTFSLGFAPEHADLDERHWASIAARHLGTEHTEIVVADDEIPDHYDALVDAIDQPSVDGTNTYLVAMAAQRDVTVAMSGLGGDELFAGYGHFGRIGSSHDWGALRSAAATGAIAESARTVPSGRIQGNKSLHIPPMMHLGAIRAIASETRKRQITTQMFQDALGLSPATRLYEECARPHLDVVGQITFAELKVYLSNTLLRDADAMSMAHSLELRPMLLDHEVASYAFALPGDLKLDGGATKVVFLKAIKDLMPPQILSRGKVGFELPLSKWMGGVLCERVCETLSWPGGARIFDADYLADTKKRIVLGDSSDKRVWAHVILLEWLRSHRCEVA